MKYSSGLHFLVQRLLVTSGSGEQQQPLVSSQCGYVITTGPWGDYTGPDRADFYSYLHTGQWLEICFCMSDCQTYVCKSIRPNNTDSPQSSIATQTETESFNINIIVSFALSSVLCAVASYVDTSLEDRRCGDVKMSDVTPQHTALIIHQHFNIHNATIATPPDVVCPPGGWRKFEGRCYKLLTDYNQNTLCR